MLAPGNYVQWKSRIKRYIDTKPNHELIHHCLDNPPYELGWKDVQVPVSEGSPDTRTERLYETYKNVSQEICDQLNAEVEAVQIIITGIDYGIYSTVDACANACEIKFTSRDGESLESYYSRFYKMMNELVRNQCNVTNHQVNVQFLLQLQPEWQRFVTLVKQSQELKTISYHKLYDILEQHQNEVNEIRAERIARVANPLALVAQQQPVYNPQNHPTHYTQNSSTRSHQAATRNRGKAIVNSPQPIYDQEPSMVADDDDTSKDKEIDKLMALISLSFKKIYKPANNNLRTSSNTSRANQDNSPRINKGTGYENQREKMLLCKQEETGIQLNAEQADWKDDTDDESNDQELEAHYMYMAKIKEVSPDAVDSGPIFDTEPDQKVQNDDHYDVFTIECEHPEQYAPVHETYPIEQEAHNVIIESLDMNYDNEQIDQNDEDADLVNERELLASLIEKLKCEIDESKNHNKFLETSNKKSQAELKRRDSIEYASEMELACAKVRGDFLSYKMESQKSCIKYTQTINDLNQTISKMKNKLSAHQDTISILTQQKEAQIKLYKSREDKELEKVIDLENKVKVLDNIVNKTGQTVQTMNMLNNKCRTSFAKPEFLKKAQRANPRLYDVGCYNDNLALMLAPESDEVVRLEKKSQSKLSDLIKPFDCAKLNSLYDLFVSQRKKSSEQRYFSERSRLSHIVLKNGNLEESFNKQSTLLEKRMDESIPLDKQVIPTISVSRPQLKSNPLEDRVMHNNSQGKKQEVEDHRRDVKFSMNKTFVTACNDSLNAKTSNVNFVCITCGISVLNGTHYKSVPNDENSRTSMPMTVSVSSSASNHFTEKPIRKTANSKSNQKPRNTFRKLYERVRKTWKWWYIKFTPSGYMWKPKSTIETVIPNVNMPLGNASRTTNVLDTQTSRNDQIAPILGYGDLVQGAVTIKRVYYVEGLNHNLFSVGQFYDADLEVAFQKSTCYIRDLKGNDLLIGSRGSNLYSITLQDSNCPNPICLMAKASSSQAWLWHRRLSHLNFDTINLLSKNDIVVGLPKFKFVKDHLCSSCELGKAKRKSFHTKITPSLKRRLHLLHMDLRGPMRVASINGKRYVGLQAQVRIVRTDKGTVFLNQTLHAYFAAEGIHHQTSVARTPEQNGVVERRNRTLVEAARTMLSAAKVPLFFWAEVIATSCFTQNLRNGENLDKMKEKGDACIFVGYSTQSRAYRVFIKRTRVIVESIHVNFDELPQMASEHNNKTVTTSTELDLLFSLMFDELLNGSSKVVSKSSDVSASDASNHRQQKTPFNNQQTPDLACQVPPHTSSVSSNENMNQADTYAQNDQVADDEFINIFSTPVQG
nr:hypothetical protein [Tanacetum cinerariifolium]